MAKRKIEERLLANVIINSDNNCWEWQGALANGGYGVISIDKKLKQVHRVSYSISREIPINELEELHKQFKLIVMHKCDNRICVNPEHLRLGTYRDNQIDMVNKGRDKNGIDKDNWKCKKGHKLIRKANGRKVCDECQRKYVRDYYHRRRQA